MDVKISRMSSGSETVRRTVGPNQTRNVAPGDQILISRECSTNIKICCIDKEIKSEVKDASRKHSPAPASSKCQVCKRGKEQETSQPLV